MSINNKITIESLKSRTPPQAPKRCDGTLRCIVLSKTPLKAAKYGKMFSPSLADDGPCASSMIKAVCFEEAMFTEFEVKETYDVKSFKLRQAFGRSNDQVELVIDYATTIDKSPVQLTITKKSFNIAAILRKESEGFRFVDVTAKIISVEDVCMVGKPPNNKEKRDVILADESGVIDLVLWRKHAINFQFEAGDVIEIQNAVTTIFNNKVMLSATFDSSIAKVQRHVNVPATAKLSCRKRGLISTLDTRVTAIKEFKTFWKCVTCKGSIDWEASQTCEFLTCPSCSAIFLSSSASIYNECMVMIPGDQQWYSANSGVSSE